MTTQTIYQAREIQMTVLTCGECGIAFAFDERLRSERKRDGRSFYCPNGHPRCYRETEEDRLRSRVKMAEEANAHNRERIAGLEKSNSALRGVVTRTKNRVAAGRCPECREHFPNLHRHMHDKHPDYNQPDENGIIT